MKNTLLMIFLSALVGLYSCQGERSEEGSAQDSSETENNQEGEIMILLEQFREAGMKVGDPEISLFSTQLSATGIISPSVSGMAKINTLVPGRILKINHSVGDRVRKGDPLFSMESYEIVALQQEYAEVYHQLDLLRADYDRYLTLSEEQVIALKEFQRTRSEYNTMLARSEGLKAKLQMIGLDPSEVENGKIHSFLTFDAPIGGVVSRRNLVVGQFIEPRTTVMELVDPDRLQLVLRVFETGVTELAEGQMVQFFIPGQTEMQYKASLSHVGKSIDLESKTIQCIAQLEPGDRGVFVNNLYVEAKIITCQRETLVVPEHAVVSESERDFVWVKVAETEIGIRFRKVAVRTGMTQEGYTEILDRDLSGVLLVGAFDLPSSE